MLLSIRALVWSGRVNAATLRCGLLTDRLWICKEVHGEVDCNSIDDDGRGGACG